MGELAVHLVGDGALLEHHHHGIVVVGQGRGEDVDAALQPKAGLGQLDPVFADAGPAAPDLGHQGDDRRGERDDVAQAAALHQARGIVEERLRGVVAVEDPLVAADGQDRQRQGVEHGLAGRVAPAARSLRAGILRITVVAHAASRTRSACPKARASSMSATSGSVVVRSTVRSAGSSAPPVSA
jgi:hypothetical protein